MSVKGQIAPLYIIVKQWKWNGGNKTNADPNSAYLYKIIVFVGKVSSGIEKELTQFAKKFSKNYTNSELDKYFGKGFVRAITDLLSHKIHGGSPKAKNNNSAESLADDSLAAESQTNEISFDDIFAENTEDSASTTSILDALKAAEKEASADASLTTSDIMVAKKQDTRTLKSDEAHTTKGTPTLEFIYHTIWNIDTPLDLREKIWTYLNIPTFCQYLSVRTAADDIIPLYYNIYNNNKLIRLSIEQVLTTTEKYNGIPILNKYYAFRDFFFVQTLDNFEIMEKFANIGTTSAVLDLYDARDFLGNLDLGPLRKDKNTEQLLYYGFFILFWPMFTDDVFHEYIVANGNISELAKMYPDLLPRQSDRKTANENEYKLFNLFYTLTKTGTVADKKMLAEIEKTMYIRIAKNTIINFSYGENRRTILSLRNLFDRLVLSEEIVAVKFSTLYADQRIDLHKTYKTTKELQQPVILNSLIIRCILTEIIVHDKQRHIAQNVLDVHIFENGNYSVKCEWADSTHYTFDAAIKLAADFVNKKLIAPINKMKGDVLHHSYDLIPITQGVVKFANINAEVFYRKNLDTRNLHLFRLVMQEFYEAGIYTSDLSKEDDNFNFTYYLRKGSYQQDRELLHKKYQSIANTYEYLTKTSTASKWSQIYVRNKAINIILRNTDLKFSLVGMWDTEFNIAYSYILLALYMLYSNAIQKNSKYIALLSKEAKVDDQLSGQRNIKSLKQIDPVLYDFKRYNSDLVYSKICQKPNQPKILTIAEYKALPEKERAKAIKYWNFTTQTDTYYYAPNPKYPYINFIVGKHPLNYCIPCAKKTSFEKKSNIKHKIYEACIKSHAYEHERKNIITDTRYIMNYGKPIDAGRLCKLPENTLEPFFYEGFYENAGFEEECYQADKFFLVGIEQDWEGIPRMGILHIIAAALEIRIDAFISEIKKKILANPTLFNILLNGKILREFYDHKAFIDAIHKIFIHTSRTHTLVEDEILQLNWMEIFTDILFYYFNIVVVEFIDQRYRYSHSDGMAAANESASLDKQKFDMEEAMAGDFVELKLNQRIDVVASDAGAQYRYLIVLTKHTHIYPIYIANPIVYFKTKVVNQRIFNRADPIIGIFAKFVLYAKQHISVEIDGLSNEATANELVQLTQANAVTDNKSKYIASYYTTLAAIDEYLEDNPSVKYEITKMYVNAHNMCYYIAIKDKSGNIVYLPISLTKWSPRKNVVIDHTPFLYSGKMDLKSLNRYLAGYNAWIADKYADDGIRIDKWIATPQKKVFGFMFEAVNYYFNNIAESAALAIKKVPVWIMPYDISEINKQIYANAPIKTDPLVNSISDGFYKNHLYQLLLLEFNTLFAREKNSELRTKLKKIIMGSGKTSLIELFDEIAKVLTKYYAEFTTSMAAAATKKATASTYGDEANIMWEALKMEDYNRIIEVINAGIVDFMDKPEIFRTIDQAVFNFDKIAINRFKSMSRDQIKKELSALAKKIVQIGSPPKVTDVPNILVPCATNKAYYCRANKLVIPEKRLDALLDILVADIQNPLKEKWIFAPLFADNIINFLKFEVHPLETISVELV